MTLLELDAVLLHLLVQRRAVDAEHFGRVLAVPAVAFERVENDLPFGVGEGRLEVGVPPTRAGSASGMVAAAANRFRADLRCR